MVSFEDFKPGNYSPIYLQIFYYIERAIVSGKITNGEKMPSKRVLSALLGTNPNTVQKSFKMLEDHGLITSNIGARSLVTIDEVKKE